MSLTQSILVCAAAFYAIAFVAALAIDRCKLLTDVAARLDELRKERDALKVARNGFQDIVDCCSSTEAPLGIDPQHPDFLPYVKSIAKRQVDHINWVLGRSGKARRCPDE